MRNEMTHLCSLVQQPQTQQYKVQDRLDRTEKALGQEETYIEPASGTAGYNHGRLSRESR